MVNASYLLTANPKEYNAKGPAQNDVLAGILENDIMDRKRGTDKIVDFEDNYYSIGGSGVDTLIPGADQDIFICKQGNNNKVLF